MLLLVLMFFMEIRVMLFPFWLMSAEQLSDTMELPGFCLSSGSLEWLHLNLRLTTLTRMMTTTIRITTKLMTPKAATVKGDFSSVGVVDSGHWLEELGAGVMGFEVPVCEEEAP